MPKPTRRGCSSPLWWSVCAHLSFFRGRSLEQDTYALSVFTLPGSSGTGRTTFVNTLCESEVLAHKVSDNPETAHVEEGIRIKPCNVGA